jgi:hypothetical protein
MNEISTSPSAAVETARRFQTLLRELVEDSRREIEWVDLLCQLEFFGCRKLVRSVPFDGLSFDILQHLSDEASRASLLKAVVEKAGLRPRSWADAPLAQLGWQYYQGLDERISRLQEDARAHGPAVSWVIENRVFEIYPMYLATTRNASVKQVLTRILAQDRRLVIPADPLPIPSWFRDRAIVIEAELWDVFCAALADWLKGVPVPASPMSVGRRPLVH